MLGAVKEIDFDNITEGVPAFLTIAAMPLTYSIGAVSYTHLVLEYK